MKFSKKTAHRIIVSLAMLAPVIYLFGVMIGALVGFKDTFPLSADYEVPVSTRVVEFNQLADPSKRTLNVPDFVDGVYTTLPINQNTTFTALNRLFDTIAGHKYIATYYVLNSSAGSSLLLYDNTYSMYRNDFVSGSVYTAEADSNYSVNLRYLDVGKALSFRFILTDLTLAYGAGKEPSVSAFYADFPDIYYPYETGKNVVFDVYGVPDNSQYLFNQFFPKDNFLVRVGANALSAEPVGFAPFGAFLSYLDTNMLHASESQMALMIYGEVYWALHIVLADLVYHVAVFFPNLIERVFDWFGQKGLEDD